MFLKMIGALCVAFGLLSGSNPGLLPDPKLTPGDVLAVTKADICAPGYAKKTRNVPPKTKANIYRKYGIKSHKPHQYEVDHLISLELGGSNSEKNLWIEPYDLNVDGKQMGASEKDKAENATHKAVCDGEIDLKEAQAQIAKDWTALYRRFVAKEFPAYVAK